MCADRDNTSQPGLRALLGRLLHGLFPYRLLQLVGAAWSYLTGQWVPSLLSLPSGWVVHRSVRAGELPEMLEALGLRPGTWEEPGDCLDELGPWKDLLTPAVEADLDLMKSWKGFSAGEDDEVLDSALDDLGTWQKAVLHTNMKAFWGQRLTHKYGEDPSSEGKEAFNTHARSFADQKLGNASEPCQVTPEQTSSQLQSSALGLMSCILNVGASEVVLNWVEQQHEQIQESFADIPSQNEAEIQHIRNKRLWFLQKNQAQEGLTSDLKEDVGETEQNKEEVHEFPNLYSSPTPDLKINLPVFEWHESQIQETCDNCDLMSDDFKQGSDLQMQGLTSHSSNCDQLQVSVLKVDLSHNDLHSFSSSPDKDQGYHSLEDWQCAALAQSLKSLHIEACESGRDDVLSDLPTEHLAPCSLVDDKTDDHNVMGFDRKENMFISSVPVCANSHIGYILGTVVSDDEEADLISSTGNELSDKEEENDDGFGSEASVSTTDSEVTDPDEVALWNSFCSSDPYNLQNFTASLQTGVSEEDPLPQRQDQPQSDDEEEEDDDDDSWCDSDEEPSTDSDVESSDDQGDSSADEEENQKLWNAFLKSDDPYNPLYFKAPVQTSVKKRICNESLSSKHSDMDCRLLPNKLTVNSCHSDRQHLRLRDARNVPVEESANTGRKKVTFLEKVTIHYVCSEEERKGHWEELARDRCRFHRRIRESESTIGHCLTTDHRQMVWKRMQNHWDS